MCVYVVDVCVCVVDVCVCACACVTHDVNLSLHAFGCAYLSLCISYHDVRPTCPLIVGKVVYLFWDTSALRSSQLSLKCSS